MRFRAARKLPNPEPMGSSLRAPDASGPWRLSAQWLRSLALLAAAAPMKDPEILPGRTRLRSAPRRLSADPSCAPGETLVSKPTTWAGASRANHRTFFRSDRPAVVPALARALHDENSTRGSTISRRSDFEGVFMRKRAALPLLFGLLAGASFFARDFHAKGPCPRIRRSAEMSSAPRVLAATYPVSARRLALRGAHPKASGCVKAAFTVDPICRTPCGFGSFVAFRRNTKRGFVSRTAPSHPAR